MQTANRQTLSRQSSSGDFQSLFQGTELNNVQQAYNIFEAVIQKCSAEQEERASQYKQRLISESQVMNLLESISGTYKFEPPKIQLYRKGQFFAKTLNQEKILYSRLILTRKACKHCEELR